MLYQERAGARINMSFRGNVYDNARAESFFKILKSEVMKQADVYEGIAAALRASYHEVTAAWVEEVHEAMRAGKPIPHGDAAMFAEIELRRAIDQGLLPG